MENRLVKNDYVRYVLQWGYSSSLELEQEPGGWKEDELEIIRHKEYHGIFTQLTSDLTFYDEPKGYIRNAYDVDGINAKLYLIKYRLREKEGTEDVSWQVDYIGLADFSTLQEKDRALKIKFNSNELEDLIRTHERDTFELERGDSIDSEPITILEKKETAIQGRKLTYVGESVLDVDYYGDPENVPIYGPGSINHPNGLYDYCARTTLISRGPERHASVEGGEVNPVLPVWNSGSHMFFVNETALVPNEFIKVEYDFTYKVVGASIEFPVKIEMVRLKYNGGAGDYDVVSREQVAYISNPDVWVRQFGTLEYELEYDEGLALLINKDAYSLTPIQVYCREQWLRVSSQPFFERSPNLPFLFINDAMSRLMEIITGKRKKFYSKIFGRNDGYGDYPYTSTGRYGLVGLISGFWIRDFDPSVDKYKGMQLGIRDAIDSLKAMFNVGAGVETRDDGQRLRIEDLKYFYQNSVAVRLPNQVNNVNRSLDGSLFFSSVDVGCDKGGDYENEVGLDEPNVETSFVTPIRKLGNRLNKVSKIRSDEYGMEILRRKPYFTYPDEDMRGDEDNWFIDLIQTPVSTGSMYRQREWWEDRLEALPTGVLDAESYRAFLFTPLRVLLRHGWVLRAGMQTNAMFNGFIKYISSKANSSLKMQFIGEPERQENSDIRVSELDTPRFLPEIVKFEHPVDDDLMQEILGTTSQEWEGSVEDIPNVYFQFEWTNEYGDIEAGYLLNLKPNKTGQWEMLKANQVILRSYFRDAEKYLVEFGTRVAFSGGITENESAITDGYGDIVLYPTSYKEGVLYTVRPNTGATDFEVSRGTIGTRVDSNGLLVEVPEDVPRINYKEGEVGYYLLEDSATNILTDSEDFTIGWVAGNATITLDSETILGRPAYRVITDDGLFGQLSYTAICPIDSQDYARSVFVKPIGVRFIGLSAEGAYDLKRCGIFDTQEGVWTHQGIDVLDVVSEKYPNGIWRLSITANSKDASHDDFVVGLSRDGTAFGDYEGNDSDGFLVSCAQIELGYQSSYIKTSGGTASRDKDLAGNVGSAEDFNSLQGTLYARMASFVDDSTDKAITISDGTTNNIVELKYGGAAGRISISMTVGGVVVGTAFYDITDTREVVSIAGTYTETELQLFIDGQLEASASTTGFLPLNTLTSLNLNSGTPGEMFCRLYKLKYFKNALTDEEIKNLEE